MSIPSNFPLWRLLRTEVQGRGWELLVATLVAGGGYSGILFVLNMAADAIAARRVELRTLLLFVFCVAAFAVARRYTSAEYSRMAHSAIARLRDRFCEKIRRSGLLSLEATTESRLLPVLTEHTERITQGAGALNRALPSLVMLCVSLFYVASISRIAFVICLVVLGLIVFVSKRTGSRIGAAVGDSIAAERSFFDLFGHLLHGFKELKTNRRKAADLLRTMGGVSAAARETNRQFDRVMERYILFVETAFFMLLGAVVFVLPQMSTIPSVRISDILTVAIFITGNIAILGDAWPKISRANHMIEAIEQLEAKLETFDDSRETAAIDHVARRRAFTTLQLRSVFFRYPSRDGYPAYAVGPIELTARRGEMIFLRGGNGSGKSTLLKIIAGLYPPLQGTIAVDDLVIGPPEADHYRQLVSVVFTDYHLFDRLYGMDQLDEERVRALLKRLHLDDKTDFIDGRFTSLELSTGQRKRLGLLVALMDDRPICIFDEIAADQDPEFRRELYDTWLPELKSQGRLVIVATHDEAYFNRADRVLHMEDGQFIREDKP